MTCKDKACYDSTPPCSASRLADMYWVVKMNWVVKTYPLDSLTCTNW